MSFYQQYLEQQTAPHNITLLTLHTQRFLTDSKDIGPWSTKIKQSSPLQIMPSLHKIENSIKPRGRFKTERTSNHPEKQFVKSRGFEAHVFQFVDRAKIAKAYSLQKQKQPYAFRCFQLSNSLPFQKESALKNPLEPLFISLMKYKKENRKKRIREVANRLIKNCPKSFSIPSLSKSPLAEGKSKIIRLSYQKMNFKIASKKFKVFK